MAWAYVWLLLIGFIVFRMPGSFVRGSEMSVDRAIFATVNFGTLTGFQQNLAVDEYKPAGQVMVLALTALGTLFTLVIGGCAVTRIARLPYRDSTILTASAIAVVLAMLIGAVALGRPGLDLLGSCLQGASAFGNSGVWIGQTPSPMDWRVHTILLPLAVLGGLGIPVVLDVLGAITARRPLSGYSWTVLCLCGGAYVVGAAAIWLTDRPLNDPAAVAIASFASLNSRSAGLPMLFAQEFSARAQWIIAILMLIGAAPGGSAGGLKTTSLLRLVQGARASLSGSAPDRGFGIAMLWAAALGVLICGCFLVLVQTEPDVRPDRLLYITISGATNTGLTHDRVSIVGTGMYALASVMVLGRALPMIVLWWMVRTCPEEQLPVG